MSHLVEVYAKDLGVKIGNPIFNPHFFPILDENYITIHNDGKVPAKEYDYWEEVIIIVKSKYPEAKFIQIGSGKEPKIKNADKFLSTNSIKQSAYIIKNGIMHVGIDSLPVHIASSFDKPIVSIYGHTYASTCGPVWGSKENHIMIESDRDGKKPSFSLKESPKTINFIDPEEIANAILEKLGKELSNRQTLFIGNKYKDQFIHVIPDKKYSLKNKNIVLRFDINHNEENCLALFAENKVSIVTDKPIGEEILNQSNIVSISYLSKRFDESFVNKVKKKGVSLNLVCTSKNTLAEERFKFFDDSITLVDKKEKIKNNKKMVKLPKEDFKVKSYSIYLKDSKFYPSLYEANQKENLDDIFVDLDNLMIYHEKNE